MITFDFNKPHPLLGKTIRFNKEDWEIVSIYPPDFIYIMNLQTYELCVIHEPQLQYGTIKLVDTDTYGTIKTDISELKEKYEEFLKDNEIQKNEDGTVNWCVSYRPEDNSYLAWKINLYGGDVENLVEVCEDEGDYSVCVRAMSKEEAIKKGTALIQYTILVEKK